MEVERIAVIEPGEWNAAVFASEDTWIFHRWEWLGMTATVWDLENHFFVIRNQGQIVAGIPLQISRESPPSQRVARASAMGHSGPFVRANVSTKKRRQYLEQLATVVALFAAERQIPAVQCSLPPIAKSQLSNHSGVNSLQLSGWQDASTLSVIVNLRLSQDDLWCGLSASTRQAITKAQSGGYTVEKTRWSEQVDAYYQIHQETYERTGVRPHPKSYFQGMADVMESSRIASLWVCMDSKGIAVGFLNIAHDDRTGENTGAYYWTGCSQGEHLASGVNYLLMWNAIVGAQAEGYQSFDVGEVVLAHKQSKVKNLSIFKRKFGGELRRLYRGQMTVPLSSKSRILDFGWRCGRKAKKVLGSTVGMA